MSQPLGERDVVGVHPHDVLATRLLEAAVAGAADAEILLVGDHADALIEGRVVARHLERPVFARVVDDQVLVVVVGLRPDALDRLAEQRRRVVGDRDDADWG